MAESMEGTGLLEGQSSPTWLVESMTTHRVLPDGTRVLIRPLLYSDRPELAAGFEQLSAQSRHLRFISAPTKLSDQDLEYLTNLDYRNHFAWVAFASDEPGSPGIGVARYIRDPAAPTTAEVAVTVTDRFQRRGLGTLLTRLLAEVAAANGITTFVNYVLWENADVVAQLTSEGARVSCDEPGVARVELDIPIPSTELPEPAVRHLLHTFADLIRETLTRLQP